MLMTVTVSEKLSAATNLNPELDKLYKDLENTKSIGLFTKLSIRNNATRLYKTFGEYHKGQRPPTLEELKQRYELMVQEMMVLVQDKDPDLAQEIQQTKAILWQSLSDPKQYESI